MNIIVSIMFYIPLINLLTLFSLSYFIINIESLFLYVLLLGGCYYGLVQSLSFLFIKKISILKWVIASGAGWILGILFGIPFIYRIKGHGGHINNIDILFMSGFVGLLIGIFQWLILKNHFKYSIIWIFSNIICFSLFGHFLYLIILIIFMV
jgi:hypothetical protein